MQLTFRVENQPRAGGPPRCPLPDLEPGAARAGLLGVGRGARLRHVRVEILPITNRKLSLPDIVRREIIIATHPGVAHGVVRLEADRRAGGDGRDARLARGVGQVELVAAELGVVHVRELLFCVNVN